MSKTEKITTYVSPETKARFADFARQQGIESEAQLLRAMIERVLAPDAAVEQSSSEPVGETVGARRKRVNLSLTEEECEGVERIARERGMKRTDWIVSLVRAYLHRQPQFDANEVNALTESNYQLAAIGRNLNQIARNLNLDLNASHHVTAATIETLADDIKQHWRQVGLVLDGNLNRWGIRHE
jgi:metal-responsive CopG/Arc/MetJ family transcriptional regulator